VLFEHVAAPTTSFLIVLLLLNLTLVTLVRGAGKLGLLALDHLALSPNPHVCTRINQVIGGMTPPGLQETTGLASKDILIVVITPILELSLLCVGVANLASLG
jgi:hypothetical protein